MRLKDIKVGRVYTGTKGATIRRVLEVGLKLSGNPAPHIQQVRYIENGKQQYRYLDTFARWASQEVKLAPAIPRPLPDSICDCCAEPVDSDETQNGPAGTQWENATLCNDCFAEKS